MSEKSEIERIKEMYMSCDVKLPGFASFNRDEYREPPMGEEWNNWDWGFEEGEIEDISNETIASVLGAYRYYITDLERRLSL